MFKGKIHVITDVDEVPVSEHMYLFWWCMCEGGVPVLVVYVCVRAFFELMDSTDDYTSLTHSHTRTLTHSHTLTHTHTYSTVLAREHL